MSQPYVYDFTLSATGNDRHDVAAALNQLAKKWVFQLEKGEKTGYLHYQGRLSLIKRKRYDECKKLFHLLPIFATVCLTPTSTLEAKKGTFQYVMKLDSRVEGPWSDKDAKPMYVPRHIRKITKLRPFQKSILDMTKIIDDRSIDCIYCPQGNKGKSALIGKARAAGLCVMPPVFDYKDILRMVYCMPTATAYFIDMPRAIKQDKMSGFFAGLETIKDGYAYDDRHTFKHKTFDSPRIFLFTNRKPDTCHLSADRWKFWTINDLYELVPFVPTTV